MVNYLGKDIMHRQFRITYYIYSFFAKYIYGAFGHASIIKKPMMITNRKHIFIGNNVYFREGLRMETIIRHDNQVFQPKIIIEDYVHAEQFCQIICTNKVHIQKNVVISSFVFISDTEHSFNNIGKNILRQNLKSSMVVIGEGAFLGIGVRIIRGAIIGKHSVIGANSVVLSDIPDYCMAAGVPAKIIKKYNLRTGEWECV